MREDSDQVLFLQPSDGLHEGLFSSGGIDGGEDAVLVEDAAVYHGHADIGGLGAVDEKRRDVASRLKVRGVHVEGYDVGLHALLQDAGVRAAEGFGAVYGGHIQYLLRG